MTVADWWGVSGREPNALFGVRALAASDLAGGTTTDGATVGLKLPGHRRYDDAVAQFADVDAARAAVAAIDELLGVGPRG